MCNIRRHGVVNYENSCIRAVLNNAVTHTRDVDEGHIAASNVYFVRRTSFVEPSTHILVGPAAPFFQTFLLNNPLFAAGWSIVLCRTLSHMFGVPQQPPQHDSLLATI